MPSHSTDAPYAALRNYFDRTLGARLAPCRETTVPSPLREPDDPVTWIKPVRDPADGPMTVVIAANARTRDALLTFTDGDPHETTMALLACLGAQEVGVPVLEIGHVARLAGARYFEARGLVAGLFVVPATLNYAAKVAHRPRGALAGWRVLLFVPITDAEFRMGRQDPGLLFAHFAAVGRDLMTVEPPFRVPRGG